MNIREAAAELNTTPKALRRVLRSLNTGVGLGNSYDINDDLIRKLRNTVKPAREIELPFPELDMDPGFDPCQLKNMRLNPRVRAEKLARRAARRERLHNRLNDPEVASYLAMTRAEQLERDSRRWAPVDTSPWLSGADQINA